MKINKLPINPHKADFIQFTGGLDTTSPQILIPSGYCRDAVNFEEDILGGYVSVTGYERYDGRLSPSEALFYYLPYTGPSGTIAIGSTITGATSGATGYVLAITPTQFVLTAIVGVFNASEHLLVHTSVAVTGPAGVGSVYDDSTAYYQFLAAQYYRNFIGKVGDASCSGSVLGVWYYKGIVYAFRNLVAGGVGMFKSTNTGWSQISLGYEVYYQHGKISGGIPAIGSTITEGATHAVLKAITIESGSFAANDAAGRLIFQTITNGPFTVGAFTGGILADVVSQNAITIPNQNGRYEFVTDNFTGLSTTSKMYGVDGKNRGFEFDGTTFVPINTGNTSDTPSHLTVHQGYLFYSFNGSVQFSAIGDPYNWQAISGAAEIGCGDTVTGFMRQPGNETSPALGVYCRNRSYVLYGNSPTTWQLINFNDTAGALPYSMQKVGGHAFVYDDRGISDIQSTLNFGNFLQATISQRVKSVLDSKRNSFVDSHILRDKQQLRMFFNDGTAMYATLGPNVNSFMPVAFPETDIVTCSVSQETYGGGNDVVFVGMTNGYVMQMERGTSFDGQIITSNLSLVFDNSKSYRMLKRYRRISLEMYGEGYVEFNIDYDLNYADSDYAQPDTFFNSANTSSISFDSGVFWDSGWTWDGTPLTNKSIAIEGDGMNMALKISVSSNYFYPINFNGALLEYSPQRMLR